MLGTILSLLTSFFLLEFHLQSDTQVTIQWEMFLNFLEHGQIMWKITEFQIQNNVKYLKNQLSKPKGTWI